MRYLAIAASVALAAACSGGEAAPVDATLERDLRLASTSSIALAPTPSAGVTNLETAPPTAEPVEAPRPRRAATGPRRVQSTEPTLAAAPEPEQAVEGESDFEVVEASVAESEEPAEQVADAGVALPRPVPVSFPAPGAGGGDVEGDRSSGPSAGDVIGAVLGGVSGAVIRGGVVDDCRIHDSRGRRPTTRPGSAGEARWPVSRPSVIRTRNDAGRERGGRGIPVWRRQ